MTSASAMAYGPTSDETQLDIALRYLRRGLQPVPVPHGQKSPTQTGWQNLEITEANIGDFFGITGNVGVLLGGKSGGLTDIDIDCPEALALADEFLPPTGAVFGRNSKPRSHRLYMTRLYETETKAVIRYAEPAALARDGEKTATLVELRIGGGDKGAQTIFPGSTHPSGEPVRWDNEGEPASVDGSNLKKVVAAWAAATLLLRNYPAQGARHDAALVLGGVLARKPGATADEVKRFVSAVARHAGDEQADERGSSAAGAVELLARGEPTPGLPRMREVWGAEVANAAAQWLGLAPSVDGDEIDRLAGLDLLSYERERKRSTRSLPISPIFEVC
jgi:hypothetical protein